MANQQIGTVAGPPGLGGGEWESKLEQLAAQESENLVKSFQKVFEDCTKACKKPNILVAGITGSGKSSVINAVFGSELAKAGAGMPVTQHFQKFEPADKPVRIYDSKGLEWSAHEEFIKETGKFFIELREKTDVADHIHVVWYVINTARGRFEPFEGELVRSVFHPTPVIFILNKTDSADSAQINAIKKVVEDENLPNNKGIHICIADREIWSQSWCTKCFSDDVVYDEETKGLECCDCGHTATLEATYGMQRLIEHTCELLPELAKDAFMFSQTASLAQKDARAKDIIKTITRKVSLDTGGNFIKRVAEMCARLFVIWGWPLTADTFREGLGKMQQDYLAQLNFSQRIAASAMDKLFGSRLSRGFTGLIGIAMNRGMKRLNHQLIEYCARGELDKLKVQEFMDEGDFSERMTSLYFAVALREGPEAAIDKFWDITPEELEVLASQMNLDDFQMPTHPDGAITDGSDSIDPELLKQLALEATADSGENYTMLTETESAANPNAEDAPASSTSASTTTADSSGASTSGSGPAFSKPSHSDLD